jgi:hypothetical protein
MRRVAGGVPTLRAVPRWRKAWSLLSAALVAVLVGWSGAAGATRGAPAAAVPQGFVGMVVDEPVWPDPWIDLQHQVDVMTLSGVQSLRVVFNWAWAQPYHHWSQVPADQRSQYVDAGGVPTDFSRFDQIVSAASRDGQRLLPVVLDAPAWDGEKKAHTVLAIPKADGPYVAFVTALVRRYGPGGTFWQTYAYDRKVPIRQWQLWNEPNIFAFWPDQPFEARYTALLMATSKAIKSVDPGAKVVLAGMPNYSWIDLARIYQVKGARGAFDVVAIHPYTKDPQGVLTILGYDRQVMNRNGDRRKPIIADEISWPSSMGKTTHDTGYDFATTESGQAADVKRVIPMLVANRRRLNLLGFYYYDWAGLERQDELAFDFSGLFRVQDGQFVAKPVYRAFQQGALAAEGR